MYKYLLTTILVIFTSNAHGYTYNYRESSGTYLLNPAVNDVCKETGELSTSTPYITTWCNQRFDNRYYRISTNTNLISEVDTSQIRRAHVYVSMPGVAKAEHVFPGAAQQGPIDIGSVMLTDQKYTFEYECRLPRTFESSSSLKETTITVSAWIAYDNEYGHKSDSFQCNAIYDLSPVLEMELVDTVLNLKGSRPSELTGSTRLNVSGAGGTARIQIVNEHDQQVTVSLRRDQTETTTTQNLTRFPELTHYIYVHATPRNPGTYVYPVRLIAEIE